MAPVYDLDRANATCVNEAAFESAFVQSMLAADASVFLTDEDFDEENEEAEANL